MQRIILMLMTVLAYSNLSSQTFTNEGDIYNYLKGNIINIDQIEGVYKYASYTQKNNDAPVRVPIAPVNVAIVAVGNVFNAYWITNGNRLINQKFFMQIKKIEYLNKLEATFYGGEPKEVEFLEEGNFRVYKEKAKSKTEEGSIESNIYYFEKVFPSKAEIEAERARYEAAHPKFAKCTGFVIGKNLIVTNLSVVEKAKKIMIKGVKGDINRYYTAMVMQTDKENDLAILGLTDETVQLVSPVIMNKIPLEVGNDVYVLGYPLTAATGEEVRLTNGIVSSKTGYQGEGNSYQITASIQTGNIGGPVYDKKGALVGVINARKEGAENANYCIKAIYIKGLIDALPVKIKLPVTNTIAAKPLPEKVKVLRKYVYLIEVEY